MSNNTPQQTVRLDAVHRSMVTDLQATLASPLLPAVTVADAIRAAIRNSHNNLVCKAQVAAAVATSEP